MRVAFLLLASFLACSMALGVHAAEMECYHLKATGPVTVTLPRHGEGETVVCKWPSGKCKKLPVRQTDDQITIRIGVEDMEAGETYLILYAPDWLNLHDSTPPQAVRLELDGKTVKPGDLGWLTTMPRALLVEIQDKENPINEASLALTVNGRRLTPKDKNMSYQAESKKAGVLTCDLTGLLHSDTGGNEIVIHADDFAVDDRPLEVALTFKTSPSRKMDDGTVIRIDSLVDSDGWRRWWVVADGRVMKDTDKTTAGNTWQSDKTASRHWVEFDFPKPRKVGAVEIWWAYWECFRTSRNYEIQTWDGGKWVTQAKVTGQKEMQCSRHTFPTVTTTKVRLRQPAGGGHSGRKDLMWIAEVKILPE
ncbi:MAG: discoidin domain-containing protein [Planctomycetes bacterium]|nr:discoidin domain-containing protein [Planctomycetota bacterium]